MADGEIVASKDGVANCTAPANDPRILEHLVGEKIVACFEAAPAGLRQRRYLYLVVESGHAVVLHNVDDTPLAFWVERPEGVKKVVDERKEAICEQLRRLRQMAGIFRDRLP